MSDQAHSRKYRRLPKTNTGPWLKNTYPDVRFERVGEITYPFAFIDGYNSGTRMFSEELCNYLYLRHGEVSSGSDTAYTSCTKTVTDTYPVRLVFHSIEKEGGNFADRRAVVIQQLLGQYRYEPQANSNISRVRFEATGRNADKFAVFEEEAAGAPISNIKDVFSIGAVDFDVLITYTPSEDCIDDDLFCNLPAHTQVPPCPVIGEDILTVNYTAGQTAAYINPTGLKTNWGQPTNQSNIDSIVFTDQDSNTLTPPFTNDRDNWVLATIVQTNTAAASTFDIARGVEDDTGSKSAITGANYRWSTLQGMTEDTDNSRLNPYVIIKTGNNGSLVDGATGSAVTPPFKMRVIPSRNSGGQYYIGFSQTPYSLPAANVHTSISWAFLWSQTQNRLIVSESAVSVFTINNYSTIHAQNEELEIENTGAAVFYRVNGVLVYTSLNLPGGGNCQMIVAPTHQGIQIEDCRVA